jgi:hypothetical protein
VVVVVSNYGLYGRKWYEQNRESEKERNKVYYEANKEKVIKRTSKRSLKSRYNLTPEDFLKMVEYQQGVCAICKKPPKEGRNLDIDHNHKTGKVRGLLCNNCNRGLGHLQDSKELLHSALVYLTNTDHNIPSIWNTEKLKGLVNGPGTEAPVESKKPWEPNYWDTIGN